MPSAAASTQSKWIKGELSFVRSCQAECVVTISEFCLGIVFALLFRPTISLMG